MFTRLPGATAWLWPSAQRNGFRQHPTLRNGKSIYLAPVNWICRDVLITFFSPPPPLPPPPPPSLSLSSTLRMVYALIYQSRQITLFRLRLKPTWSSHNSFTTFDNGLARLLASRLYFGFLNLFGNSATSCRDCLALGPLLYGCCLYI